MLLDNFTITDSYKNINEFKEDDLAFLNLSGCKTYYSQGITGQNVIVAVIDSGVSQHSEFEDRLLVGHNSNMRYSNRQQTADDLGHGTHCAGTIAGKKVGIAPGAKILPIKVLDGGGGSSVNEVIAGLEWIRNWRDNNGNKVNIVSMSISSTESGWGGPDSVKRLNDTIKKCVEDDILVCCSMGNTSKEEKRYPACFEEVVAIGAVDIAKNKAYFSTSGNHVDVCQVGVNVLSCYNDGTYVKLNGTSMSTPIVAGIAALLASRYYSIYKKRIPERILYESLKLNTKNLGIPGVDKLFGAGFCTLQPMNMKLELKIGDPIMKINGVPTTLDTEPIMYKNRFYASLRHIIGNLGGAVNYDEVTQIATFEL